LQSGAGVGATGESAGGAGEVVGDRGANQPSGIRVCPRAGARASRSSIRNDLLYDGVVAVGGLGEHR